MYKENVSEQENSDIQETDNKLNSRYEEEQDNSEIQATDDKLNSWYEEKPVNSEIQATDQGVNSSYDLHMQRTKSLNASNTQKMEGGKTQFNSKDRKVIWFYINSK